MKNYYWLIDDATTDAGVEDETRLEASTKEEAIYEADLAWRHLTRREQEKRDAFYVIWGPELEEEEYFPDHFPDQDKAKFIYDFKCEEEK